MIKIGELLENLENSEFNKIEKFLKEDIKEVAKKKKRGDVIFQSDSSKVKDDADHFPINDLKQARNALARVGQYDKSPEWYKGSLKSLKDTIKKAVKKKFPSIEVSESVDELYDEGKKVEEDSKTEEKEDTDEKCKDDKEKKVEEDKMTEEIKEEDNEEGEEVIEPEEVGVDDKGYEEIDISDEELDMIAKEAEVNLEDFNKTELKVGMEVEKEHDDVIDIDNKKNLFKIAIAHLKEVPDYYSKLKRYVEVEELEEAVDALKGWAKKHNIDLTKAESMWKEAMEDAKNKNVKNKFAYIWGELKKKVGDTDTKEEDSKEDKVEEKKEDAEKVEENTATMVSKEISITYDGKEYIVNVDIEVFEDPSYGEDIEGGKGVNIKNIEDIVIKDVKDEEGNVIEPDDKLVDYIQNKVIEEYGVNESMYGKQKDTQKTEGEKKEYVGKEDKKVKELKDSKGVDGGKIEKTKGKDGEYVGKEEKQKVLKEDTLEGEYIEKAEKYAGIDADNFLDKPNREELYHIYYDGFKGYKNYNKEEIDKISKFYSGIVEKGVKEDIEKTNENGYNGKIDDESMAKIFLRRLIGDNEKLEKLLLHTRGIVVFDWDVVYKDLKEYFAEIDGKEEDIKDSVEVKDSKSKVGDIVKLKGREGVYKIVAYKDDKVLVRSHGEEVRMVDEIDILKEEVKEQEEFTTVARGVSMEDVAKNIATKEDGMVVKDDTDDKKFMVIKKK
jgi:hypothetical protein